MAQLEKTIPIPSATLDVSVQYQNVFLNNCLVEFYSQDGALDTGPVPLGDFGRKPIVIAQHPTNDVMLRIKRTPLVPQDDPTRFPVLGGDYHFGSITASARVLIVVADPPKIKS